MASTAIPRQGQEVPATKPRGQGNRSASTAGAAPRAEQIAARAYEIWQKSGCPDGKHEEHWYRAERELRARSTPSK